ncbi:CZB domain-containing protein [Kordiimonas laminariae]|uniref:CZB domain-containing protein n=1 Tax=Kordiimonas laminariae TaxID=2917717 RepID=UPI001FF6E9CB|nr:CZB domain-containing protein [Kordiimonas laminariae]MCK0069765.1 CZB domain-containing protein [Kordiimonas laminariae]
MKTEEVLDKGFVAHSNVKARLKRIIAGEEEAAPESVRADNKCIVGEWIYGPGSEFSDTEEYKKLKSIHADFHEEAYQALMLHKKGDTSAAQDYVETGPFEDKSREIKTALFAMKKAAQ